MIKRALPMLALAVSLASTNMTALTQSKGDQALLDALVRKGVLTEKEAEEISAETAKEAVTTSAAKIQIGDWVQELKLSGDLRLRNQADQRTPMILTNPLLGPQDRNINRDRWRFRLRLSADFKLAGNFFGGVMLSTSDNRSSDTKNATYTGGYDNYGVYISRAFMGWAPTPGLTFIAGKQANPFYTTDLIYDPEVDPQGIVERIDFHKFFNMTFGEPVADGKEGKAPPPAPPSPGNSLELSLIAGQFVFQNNNADSGSTQLKWDSYQFQEQLLAKLKIGDKLTITVAPGFLNFNDASSGGTPGAHGAIIPPVSTTGSDVRPKYRRRWRHSRQQSRFSSHPARPEHYSRAGRHHLQDFWQAAELLLGFCVQLLGGRSFQQRLRSIVFTLLRRWQVGYAELQWSRPAQLFG